MGSGSDTDIRDPRALGSFLKSRKINRLDWIINCAAYTQVDRAEDEPELCREINVQGVKNLAVLAKSTGARILQLSSDYIFSPSQAQGKVPLKENDRPCPRGVYAQTKAEAEDFLLSIPGSVVVRTSWLFGPGGRNFVATILSLLANQKVVRVVNDQTGCPTSAVDLGQILARMVSEGNFPGGLWHVCNSGFCTWYTFALEIRKQALEKKLLPWAGELVPVTSEEISRKAPRPDWSVLDCSAIENRWKTPLRPWQEALSSYLDSRNPGT